MVKILVDELSGSLPKAVSVATITLLPPIPPTPPTPPATCKEEGALRTSGDFHGMPAGYVFRRADVRACECAGAGRAGVYAHLPRSITLACSITLHASANHANHANRR